MANPSEFYELYDVRLKVYGDRVEVTQYSSSIGLIKEEFKSLNNRSYKKKEKGTGTIREDSLNRSYSNLIDLAIMNHKDFKSFITLTFSENITDLTFANSEFNKWTTKVKRVFKDFSYLCVPEFQKRGAVHYHLMTNLDTSVHDNIISLQDGTDNMYDVKYWNNGFTSVFDLKLTDDNFSVALYLGKYFWKDIDSRLFGRRKIMSSRNLKKPEVLKFDSKEVEKLEKYLNGKKLLKPKKTIVNGSDYGPDVLVISTYG